jgi:hypothetical protein
MFISRLAIITGLAVSALLGIHHQNHPVVPKMAVQATTSTTTTTVPITSKWDTRPTDPTATWPSPTDPTRKLTPWEQEVFACIRYHESRNHSFSVEQNSHAGGWYQFIPYIWAYARAHIPGIPATPTQATTDQQSQVAVWYYQRNGSWSVEWGGEKDCWE